MLLHLVRHGDCLSEAAPGGSPTGCGRSFVRTIGRRWSAMAAASTTCCTPRLGVPATAPVWFALDCCSVTTVRLVPEAERRLGWPLYPPVAVELLRLNDSAHLAAALDR